jgi:murein DD-endopeptidase MepM/ murein hydrolase activator NlpD
MIGKAVVQCFAALLVAVLVATTAFPGTGASGLPGQAGDPAGIAVMAPPLDGALKYPFTRNDAENCGRWRAGSQNYPYFGAPRDRNRMKHAGIDLYPVKGRGAPVRAMRDGKVIKVAPFYKRRNGRKTYAILIDHGEFAANYAELKRPALTAGATVKRGQIIGFVSGTKQLHFELYAPGTMDWSSWRDEKPPDLIDPTDMMTEVYRLQHR